MKIKVLLTVSALASLSICGRAIAASDPIVIGDTTATSGWMADYDVGPAAASKLAVDDINAAGGLLGHKLVIVHRDSKSDRAEGARAGLSVVNSGAKLVLTGCDFDMGGPPAMVANQKKVVSISNCGADFKFGNLSIGRYVFSMATDSATTGAVMADWGFREKHWKTAATLLDTSIEYDKSLCRGFIDRWTELAGKKSLLLQDTFRNDDSSIAPQITRIKALPQAPDAIMLCSHTPGGASAIRQIRSSGVATPLLAATWADGDEWVNAVPNLSNFYYNSYSSARGDDPNPRIQSFVAAFTKATGHRPDTGQAVTGYSVVEAWAKAVRQAGSFDSDKVVTQLETFRDVPLLAGQTTFNDKLHIAKRPMLVIGYTNGKPVPAGYWSPKAGAYVTFWK
jgi:branched-chain amino acid transport system substrate-binding protein